MSERVRVGLINTSWYAESLHLPSLKSHLQADVVAICGRNQVRAEALARQFAIPQVFTDYRALIEQGRLDAVVIAPPDDLHYVMTMDALDAGLHVLCEKPMALTAGQAQAMLVKAESAGVKHMVFFTFRWLPHTRYLHELIDGGCIGRCYDCAISYVHGGGRDGHYAWRLDGQRSNGILGDLGSHLIDLARWYNGEIARVSAQLATFVPRTGPDGKRVTPANDSAILQLEFANGAQGIIHASAVAHVGNRGLEQHIVLHGQDGTLESEFLFGNFGGSGASMMVRGVRATETAVRSLDIPDHIWGGVDPSRPLDVFIKRSAGGRSFIDAILDDHPASPSFVDGLRVQEVIDAAIESQHSGRWVSLDARQMQSE